MAKILLGFWTTWALRILWRSCELPRKRSREIFIILSLWRTMVLMTGLSTTPQWFIISTWFCKLLKAINLTATETLKRSPARSQMRTTPRILAAQLLHQLKEAPSKKWRNSWAMLISESRAKIKEMPSKTLHRTSCNLKIITWKVVRHSCRRRCLLLIALSKNLQIRRELIGLDLIWSRPGTT